MLHRDPALPGRLVSAIAIVAFLALPSAAAAASAGPSEGCGLHIAGHPGVSLELLGYNFTRTSTVHVDYTVNGRDPHGTTITTDAVGSFDLTIPTGPTFAGVYDFVITDPRCTLTPSAIARTAAPGPSHSLAPALLTAPATDAAPSTRGDVPSTPGWLVAVFALAAALAAFLLRRSPSR
jgi:hypothetical protein